MSVQTLIVRLVGIGTLLMTVVSIHSLCRDIYMCFCSMFSNIWTVTLPQRIIIVSATDTQVIDVKCHLQCTDQYVGLYVHLNVKIMSRFG